MAQQINLYNAALRRQRQWLSLANVVLLTGLFAVHLVGIGMVLRTQASARLEAAKSLDGRLTSLRAEVAQLAGQLIGGASGDQAARELADLKQQVAMRREVLDALQHGTGLTALKEKTAIGFADYLRGLARQSVDGLWLTGFSVGQGGGGMEVRGRMLAVDRLPAYIKRLNGEATFKGRQFVSLNISRSDKAGAPKAAGTPYAAFVLTSVAVGADGKTKENER